MRNEIACCYFPTTVAFLDDKEQFLNNVVLGLDKNITFQTFTSPADLLKLILKKYKYAYPKLARFGLADEKELENVEKKHAHVLIDVDIADIHKQVYSSARFQELAVLVVDYSMANMNGLEFAREVRVNNQLPFKIIMVTGEADEKLAVAAFNEGLIDKFIRKDASNFKTELNTAISKLQLDYFYDLSKTTLESLTTKSDCALNDFVFIEFFKTICNTKKIVEYYLIDEHDSFLLLDCLGKPYWLIIKNENVVKSYSDIAEDNDAPAAIQRALKRREKLPFFFTEDDMYVSSDDWGKYLHPAEKLAGQKGEYYFAIVDDIGVYKLQSEKIISYKSFSKTN
jgi:CheY-like chemotaxis protein